MQHVARRCTALRCAVRMSGAHPRQAARPTRGRGMRAARRRRLGTLCEDLQPAAGTGTAHAAVANTVAVPAHDRRRAHRAHVRAAPPSVDQWQPWYVTTQGLHQAGRSVPARGVSRPRLCARQHATAHRRALVHRASRPRTSTMQPKPTAECARTRTQAGRHATRTHARTMPLPSCGVRAAAPVAKCCSMLQCSAARCNGCAVDVHPTAHATYTVCCVVGHARGRAYGILRANADSLCERA
jgi:hypothetical protein